MKNILFALSLVLFLFASCKKSSPGNDGPRTDVKFQFSDFNWELGPLTKSAGTSAEVGYDTGDTLKNYAHYFYYRAYNSSGIKVSEKSQTSAAAEFGVISDVLDPGTYTVVFAASNKPLAFSHYGLNNDHLFNVDNGAWEDTFFKIMTINVGTETSTHPVILERIVGALELTLLDVIPMDAAKISIAAEYELGVYQFINDNRSASGTKVKEFLLTPADKGQANRKFLMHMLNISRGLRLTITSYSAQNVVMSSKTVENVWFYQNRKTLVQGNLSSQSQFSITVDPVWGAPTAPITF